MTRIKVLQVIPSLSTAGGQRVALQLAENLDKNHFEVDIICLSSFSGKPFELEASECGVKVHYLNKKLGFDGGIIFSVTRLIHKLKPQVVHNHLHALYTLLPVLLYDRVPVKIHTLHTVADKEARGWHRAVQSFAFRNLEVIPVSISDTVANSVHAVYGDIESPVINNGVNLLDKCFSDAEKILWRQEQGIPVRAFVFVSIASFGLIKNQRLIVDAFFKVQKQSPNTFLLLVGDGDQRSNVVRHVVSLGLSDKVKITGIRADIPEVLYASDCFVLASDWEGLPLSVLEAMSAGKAVIASNVGSIPEIVEHEKNGLIFTAGDVQQLTDCMNVLCNNPAVAAEMGSYSQKLIFDKYDVRKMAQLYGELYKMKLDNRMGANIHDFN